MKIRMPIGPRPQMLKGVDPRPVRQIEQDTHIAYGASCTWWGVIGETNLKRAGLLQCPKCGGELLTMDADLWYCKLDKHALRTNNSDYQAFMAWVREKCYCDPAFAKRVLEEQRNALPR